MQDNQCVVSITTYEGGLIGLSSKNTQSLTDGSKSSMNQEFAFVVSESQLQCVASQGNLIAVAGTDEIIRLFDLKNKRACGEFSGGTHSCTITALALTNSEKHLLSGGEDGKIVIWRIVDGLPLHELTIKNTSKVVSISTH